MSEDTNPLKDLFERLLSAQETQEENRSTIPGHYGFKSEEYDAMVMDILKDVYMLDKRTDVVDKHFPNLNNEDRMKVIAHATARMMAIAIQVGKKKMMED